MKPSDADLELIFLREAERRLGYLYDALLNKRNGIPETLGLKSLINNRIAEVQQRKEQQCQSSEASPK